MRHVSIICHVIFGIIVSLWLIVWFVENTVDIAASRREKVKQLLTYHYQPSVGCQSQTAQSSKAPAYGQNQQLIGVLMNDETQEIIAYQSNSKWQISRYDEVSNQNSILVSGIQFAGQQLTQSVRPIENTVVYPECDQQQCMFKAVNIGSKENRTIKALIANGETTKAITRVWFDDTDQLILYQTSNTDISSLLVENFDAKLLQSIDSTPGVNRSLTFSFYDPISKSLVLTDNGDQDQWYYSATNISLMRNPCKRYSKIRD